MSRPSAHLISPEEIVEVLRQLIGLNVELRPINVDREAILPRTAQTDRQTGAFHGGHSSR